MKRPSRPDLKLVPSAPTKKHVTAEELASLDGLGTLFGKADPRLLVGVDFESVVEAEFLTLLAQLRPRFLIDLRAVPRFDLGSINRRLVFSLLEQWATRYLDLSAVLSPRRGPSDELTPERVLEVLQSPPLAGRSGPQGPLLLLVDPPQFSDAYLSKLAQILEPISEGGWEIARVPQFVVKRTPSLERRDTIFISHATPQQNDFARWIGAQLSIAGYRVWFDLERLRGGELFWDEIETVIRSKAGKVLVAVTRESQQKPGVLDEINLAISVERSLGIDNFVVPLRVENLPFDAFRANISRKNIVDFSANWAVGLAALLAALDKEGFPKANPDGIGAVAALAAQRLSERQRVVHEPEVVQLSVASILHLPKTIHFHEYNGLPAEGIDDAVAKTGLAFVRFLRLTIGFASSEEVTIRMNAATGASPRLSVDTDQFLTSGAPELPGATPRFARATIANLLRQTWNLKARAIGLVPYETASRATAWYVPAGLVEADQVSFMDVSGTRRRKKLVGFSEKRQVYWHYAMELRPTLSPDRHFALRAHVIFTTDGRRPVDNLAKMHALRRGFCRSWWNDRWRDLTAAYLVLLSEGADQFDLPTGGDGIRVSASMLRATSPVSIVEPESAASLDTNDVEDIDDDESRWIEDELNAIDETSSEGSDV